MDALSLRARSNAANAKSHERMRALSSASIWHYEDQQAWGGQCTATSVQQSPLEFYAHDVKPLDFAGAAASRLAATKLFFKYGSGSAVAVPSAADTVAADSEAESSSSWLGGSEEAPVANGTTQATEEHDLSLHMSPQGVLYMSLLDAKLGGMMSLIQIFEELGVSIIVISELGASIHGG